MSFLIFILTLSPVLVYLIHALLIRLIEEWPLQLTAIISVLLGNIPVIFICLVYIFGRQINTTEKIAAVIYSLVVYNNLAYVYFHIFNMSETARRIHILVDLKKTGSLDREGIFKRYNSEDIVGVRLSRLLSLKQLRVENNKYKINKHFLLIAAKIYNAWARALGYKGK